MSEVISSGRTFRNRLEVGICNPVYVPSMPSDAICASYCDDIVASGLTWVRTDCVWGHIQAGGRDSWNWEEYDRFVDIARSKRLNILFILSYSVGWANGGNGQMVPPTDPADFATFAAAVVARYSPLGVKTYEIWNEPNMSAFWSPQVDAVAYAQLLQAAYTAIKSVDSGVKVLTCGLASVVTSGTTTVAPETFLQTIYTTIGKNYFDAVAYHPYDWDLPSFRKILQVMALNLDPDKKVWFTEYGNPTNGTDGQHFLSESTQATRMAEKIRAVRDMPWVEKIFIYSYKDAVARQPDREGYFGIKRSDDSSKPSYDAIQNAIM